MNLDDLMEVWRSQDASPLHGANDTLLRLALRQDEAKLRAQRRPGVNPHRRRALMSPNADAVVRG